MTLAAASCHFFFFIYNILLFCLLCRFSLFKAQSICFILTYPVIALQAFPKNIVLASIKCYNYDVGVKSTQL